MVYDPQSDTCVRLLKREDLTQSIGSCSNPQEDPCNGYRFYYRRLCSGSIYAGGLGSTCNACVTSSLLAYYYICTQLVQRLPVSAQKLTCHCMKRAGVLSSDSSLVLKRNPHAYFTSASIMEGTNITTFPDGSPSNISWGQTSFGGCSRSVYLGSKSHVAGKFPKYIDH